MNEPALYVDKLSNLVPDQKIWIHSNLKINGFKLQINEIIENNLFLKKTLWIILKQNFYKLLNNNLKKTTFWMN
jgi:hypothetical protein